MNADKIPYEQLALIGLTPEKLKGFPEEVMQQLANGELTPIINVTRVERNGVVVNMPMRLQVDQDILTGENVLMAYPMNRHFQNAFNLDPADFQRLNAGEVVLHEGKYLQRDPETNTTLEVDPVKVEMEKRIGDIESVNNIHLGEEQKMRAREGKPVELHLENETVTIGLDLREPQHFKSLNGDMADWKKQKEIEYDIAHPEFVGLVQTDENRWEKMVVEKEGYSSKTLKERPAMSQSSGMKR